MMPEVGHGEGARSLDRSSFTLLWLIVTLGVCIPFTAGRAQEFVKQSMLVAPFDGDGPRSMRGVAEETADAARNRLGKLLEKEAVSVLAGYHYTGLLARSNRPRDLPLDQTELRLVTGQLRADELVYGRVKREGTQLVATVRLARLRNFTMQQPLPIVRATTPRALGEAVAIEVARARAQLTSLRRCENALMKGELATAAREAEAAIRAYPSAVIARDCLLAALRDGVTDADSLMRVADATVALDSTNSFAEVARAQALEALRRHREAVAQWNRLWDRHSDSLYFGFSVVDALLRLQQPRTALDDMNVLRKRFGELPELRRFRFRAHAQLQEWTAAAALGDSLETEDAMFRADSAYVARHAEAARQIGDSLGALEIAVRGVRRFPGDSRLYLQYLQLLGTEQGAALPRGIARFPDLPDLRLLAAREARRAGNRRAAIRETRAALERDSTLVTQYLALADLLLEDNAPDSAAQVLARAPRTGEQTETVRSYVLARGLQLLRAAADTAPVRQRVALQLLLLADSVASREDSRAMAAAAALQVARTHLVVAYQSQTCDEALRADALLTVAAARIGAGLGTGESTAEIAAAYDAMRRSTTDFLTQRCKTGLPRPPSVQPQ